MTFNAKTMTEATRLTRAGRLAEATALLQGMPPVARPRAAGDVARLPAPTTTSGARTDAAERRANSRGVLGDLLGSLAALAPGAGATAGVKTERVLLPEGARFDTHLFTNQAGSRAYKLFVPGGRDTPGLPLLVMLHGCKQSPDDFAAGTRMNHLAQESGCLVAYPDQPASANASRCWNWFSPADQRRDQGEPSILAGITRQIIREHGADARRVYVAGLSAGGAAAAIMGSAYPDLYAAVGVHSGLACGAARDMPSAFAAMRSGGSPPKGGTQNPVPTIVFHGDRDGTVNIANADHVMTQSRGGDRLDASVSHGRSTGGTDYTRIVETDGHGRALLERWTLHGAAHAWAGGSSAGSFTDPRGPDASREMLRFFLEHPKESG